MNNYNTFKVVIIFFIKIISHVSHSPEATKHIFSSFYEHPGRLRLLNSVKDIPKLVLSGNSFFE